MASRRQRVIDAMVVDVSAREAIEDRIHQFAFGFSQLRSLDATTFKYALANFVEAVDHLPREAVCRACVAWNKRRFHWANPTFPPQAPELARAAEEMLIEMRCEERDLRIILNAAVAPPPPAALTGKQRDDAVARWDEIRAAITRDNILPGRTDEEVQTERAEMARANDVVRARERRSAEVQSDP